MCAGHRPGLNLNSLGGDRGPLALMAMVMLPCIYCFLTPSPRGSWVSIFLLHLKKLRNKELKRFPKVSGHIWSLLTPGVLLPEGGQSLVTCFFKYEALLGASQPCALDCQG